MAAIHDVAEPAVMAALPVLAFKGERQQEPMGVAAFHRWIFPGGTPWIDAYRLGDAYLLRFHELGDFEVSADGKRAAVWAAPSVTLPTIDHLFQNQVLPLALSRQGRLVLHGSAVQAGAGCVAFLGASGRGKSTLAASFATCGCPFLTDDGLQLAWIKGDLYALPSHASIRLWEDSQNALLDPGEKLAPAVQYTGKSRVLASPGIPHCGEPRRILRIFLLGPGAASTLTIKPVRPTAATLELVRHSFLLEIGEQEMLSSHFEEISRIANLDLLYHLDYPREFQALPEVRQAILQHLDLLR